MSPTATTTTTTTTTAMMMVKDQDRVPAVVCVKGSPPAISTTTTTHNEMPRPFPFRASPRPFSSTQQPPTPNSTSSSNIPFARIMSTIEHRNLRFVILDCPTSNTLPIYLEELKLRGVTDVVRLCEPTYEKGVLQAAGIQVHDWPFKDGGVPPSSILHAFLSLCDERFNGLTHPPKDYKEGTGPVIAVHCVAGLGRAPVLVTAALVEAGMAPLDAVEFVRRRRRGALNTIQLNWIDSYKRAWKKTRGGFLKRSSTPPSVAGSGGGGGGGGGAATNGAASGGGTTGMGGLGANVSLSLKESFGKVFRFRRSANAAEGSA